MSEKAKTHKSSTWVPVLGESDYDENGVYFRGKLYKPAPDAGLMEADVKERPTAGLALSNVALADGVLVAEVEFERVTEDTACELVQSYDANANHILTAGLGGTCSLYGIREYGGRSVAICHVTRYTPEWRSSGSSTRAWSVSFFEKPPRGSRANTPNDSG